MGGTRPRPTDHRRPRPRDLVEPTLVGLTTAALAAGGVAWLCEAHGLADVLWVIATVLAIVPGVVWTAVSLRRGRVGVDVIAVLSLAGTIAVGEYLAGAIVAVMLTGGRELDAAATRRATRDTRALLDRAPRFARRQTGAHVARVPVDEVAVDDLVVVGTGEVVPVDGRIEDVDATLDESALTGESEHVTLRPGDVVRSGVVDAGGVFRIRATATAADSTYAGIVRMAQESGADAAPVVRLADRYAAWFLPAVLLVSGLAWFLDGSAVRAVAVLVVATPCPLILAAPVAIVSGISRASRRGAIIRDGAALENLGIATTLVVDKTGTLTQGRPRVIDVVAAPPGDTAEVLRLAASVDQYSNHVLAEAIVTTAREQQLTLAVPADVVEQPGRGVCATMEGASWCVGALPETAVGDDWARAVTAPRSRGSPDRVDRSARSFSAIRCDPTHRAPSVVSGVPGSPD